VRLRFHRKPAAAGHGWAYGPQGWLRQQGMAYRPAVELLRTAGTAFGRSGGLSPLGVLPHAVHGWPCGPGMGGLAASMSCCASMGGLRPLGRAAPARSAGARSEFSAARVFSGVFGV
jgi:hypothetical protein